MNNEQTIATVDSGGTTAMRLILQPVTRQQRRHAAQARAYKEAIERQGTRYVTNHTPPNPKGKRHVGAKQLAKLAREVRKDGSALKPEERTELENAFRQRISSGNDTTRNP